MGIYINPRNTTKEKWLQKFAQRVDPPGTSRPPSGKVYVCLVDNGLFTAAGVAFSPEEQATFSAHDGRPKSWWLASETDVNHVTNGELGHYRKSHHHS